VKINLDYIARVEGEGSVNYEIRAGKLTSLKLNVWEPPRFFEGFLKGRKFDEAPDITARICGICPVSHMATAIRAVEKAIGFTPNEEIIRLRRIMSLSQIAASHVVHLYVLALPDYHGLKAITGMQQEITRLLRLKDVLNRVTGAFGGRALHPVAMVVGGFPKLPSRDTIGALIDGLQSIREDLLETVAMVARLEYPHLETDAEFVALSGQDGYKINKGTITSDRGLAVDEDDYSSAFEEKEVPYSNAKRTIVKGRGALMVGALARLNLNLEKLHAEAKKAAQDVGFAPRANNPYMNNVAQAIESVHCVFECIELLAKIEGKDHFIQPRIQEGFGSAVTEAPRGLLCHQYFINRRGVVEKANIVTPTAHNFLSLEDTMKKLITENIDLPRKELTLKCEMLVRAYDPCFSCSVH
jgi:coenzyme F420-reducing hydrogenase alpha subunit